MRASPSENDVAAVVEAVEAAEAAAAVVGPRRAAPDPSAALLLQPSREVLAYSTTGALHENDRAEVVIVCEPDLHSNLMGALHPAGSLYERPVNMAACTQQHAAFRAALRRHGVRCLTVKEVLLHGTDSVRARCELEDLAAGRLLYELDAACDERLLAERDRFFVGDAYKRSVLEAMSPEQLCDVVLTCPRVTVLPSFRDTGFTARYAFEPLTNMQYTRDSAVTTARGLVLARLRSQQRQKEVELLEFCFNKLGLKVIGAVQAPGYLEGGDFFTAGSERCFVGIGLRSNREAAEQLMEGDLLGTRLVAVVRDEFECDQARLHLDCIFNIVSDDCVLLAEDVIGQTAPLRRLVDEYERSSAPGGPRYTLRRAGVEFSAYLAEAGFHILPVPREASLSYACNVLNLGDSNILCCHAEMARQLVRCPHFHGEVEYVDISAVTSMYGALHCSSQPVCRSPRGDL